MPVLDPLTASALLIMASSPSQPLCTQPQPTAINVSSKTDGIEYDYTKSLSKIQSVQGGVADPYGIHSSSITQGFMEGQVRLNHEVRMQHRAINRQGDTCLWYKSIDVTITIDPKIVIAREIKRDRCMHKSVLAHEKKHISADRKAVNKAAKDLGAQIYDHLEAQGFIIGPIPAKQVASATQAMIQAITIMAEKAADAMSENRSTLQAAIDTREEYDRVAALCPDFYDRKEWLYNNALKAKERASQ